MASLADIGVPGQSLNNPPLTAWQAAVRDALTPLVTVLGVITPTAPWQDYGGASGGLYVTKQGRIVVMNALLKPSTDQTLAIGTALSVASLPAGMNPPTHLNVACFYQLAATSAPVIGRATITTAGVVQFLPSAAGTLSASSPGMLSIHATFRSQT